MEYNLNTQAPHLVPPPMGEETLVYQSSLPHKQYVGQINLASPMGRGARQCGEGMGFRGGNIYA